MADCQLTIELDDPNGTRLGGTMVSGKVIVKPKKDVQCKNLEIKSFWSTHGRGNVTQGDVAAQSLFEGSWIAGQEYRYPFSVLTAEWPPTYYGHYLNVSHFVKATASVPWNKDPTAQEEFKLVAQSTPENLTPTQNVLKKPGWIRWVIGFGIALPFLLLVMPLLLFLVPLGLIVYAIFWFFKIFLPSQITGPVEFALDSTLVAGGKTLKGKCQFTPKRNTRIDGVTWTIRCSETCVSGSGSNRKTHEHELLCKSFQLLPPGMLEARKTQSLDLEFTIPNSVPHSMKFVDNEVKWVSELRIHIPTWPDWSKELPFIVQVPDIAAPSKDVIPTGTSQNTLDPLEDDDPFLTEVYQQILQSADDPGRLQMIIDSVKDQTFSMMIDTQGEADEPMESDEDEEFHWVAATDTPRGVKLVLCLPLETPVDSILWNSGWKGSASILNLESESGRIMMKVLTAP